MKPRKIVLIAMLGLILVVAVLREMGILDLNFYSSSSHVSSHSTLNSSSSVVNWGEKKPQTVVNQNDISLIIVSGKDTIYKSLNKLLPIIVRVRESRTGQLWTPLYKSARFSIVGTPEFDPRQELKGEYDNGAYTMSISGEFSLKGEIVIKGFCTYRQARQLVNAQIAENFTAKIKEYLVNESNDLLQVMVHTSSKVPPQFRSEAAPNAASLQ